MQNPHVPVHLALRGFPTSEPLRNSIRGDFDRLKGEHPELRDCRVAVELVNGPDLPSFCAHIELRLPERQNIVSGEASEGVPSALRAALDCARRQLAMPSRAPA